MSLDKKPELTTPSEKENDCRILVPCTSNPAIDENWREHCVGALDTYKYALEKNLLTDVTFLVGPDSTVCHAHRLILALASPVFQAMFYGGLAEKGDTIKIPDVTPEGFKHLLRFIYCEDGPFEDDLDAFQTCIAADKYCVSRLKHSCELFLQVCPITSSNIWGYFENSVFLNAENAIQRSLNFLKKNIKEALDHESFLDISPKTVEALLKTKALCIEEYYLILHIGRWAEQKSEDEKDASVYDLLRPMLPLMRFGTLTSAEFVSFLDISSIKDLLSTDDALTILKHLCNPEQCKLPDWCCKEKTRTTALKKDSKDKIAEANKKPNESKKRKKVFEISINTPKRPHRHYGSSEFSTDSSSSSSSSSSSTSTDFSSNTSFMSDDD